MDDNKTNVTEGTDTPPVAEEIKGFVVLTKTNGDKVFFGTGWFGLATFSPAPYGTGETGTVLEGFGSKVLVKEQPAFIAELAHKYA